MMRRRGGLVGTLAPSAVIAGTATALSAADSQPTGRPADLPVNAMWGRVSLRRAAPPQLSTSPLPSPAHSLQGAFMTVAGHQPGSPSIGTIIARARTNSDRRPPRPAP